MPAASGLVSHGCASARVGPRIHALMDRAHAEPHQQQDHAQFERLGRAHAGISVRHTTSTAPAASSVSVCPSPQQAPSHAALALLRSPVTSVDTAAR